MLVASFIEGAVEIGEADVDDAVIDQALGIMRPCGTRLAHRDIKPANLMVSGGRAYLIDAAFAQVRPSPWRQAVDLGNMMLVLATRSDAERVYERALRLFTPDDVAEAFAATRASPGQPAPGRHQAGRPRPHRRVPAPRSRPPPSRSSAGASVGWRWPWGW